ncbi:MAG: phosphoribosylformylglycinamidine synthase [Opitutales bacterium]
MILLQGRPAYSTFRCQALLAAIQNAAPEPGVESIDAVRVYLLETESALDEAATEKIFALLAAEGNFVRDDGFFVTPRKGTISPWSSKATDIFHHCGLHVVRRVEHGIHFRLLDASGHALALEDLPTAAANLLHDRMTETVTTNLDDFFQHFEPASLRTVPLAAEGRRALCEANTNWGLALNDEEIDYLVHAFQGAERDPTDAELVMFSQVNSEHCRHKIFNADWIVDGERSERSLFSMIRHTHEQHPEGTVVAYADNSGVIEGSHGAWWEAAPDGERRCYRRTGTRLDILCKVETHNHPTAIAPFPGAATGVGGEIRDEGATGRGGRSKAGLAAYIVSHLRIPDYPLPWEAIDAPFPERLASPLDIMLEAPIGAAAFGNEFGRPQLCGVFRTFETEHDTRLRGYHKPIMAAGGMGNLKREHTAKREIPERAPIIQLGGPSMKIGLGGGAASSIGAGSQSEELDFDSVQRGNPEMQRRCQQVIDACIALGAKNPILSIHDIGAGGLSNGVPELVEATGGHFHVRRIHNEDRSMSPMEIWCNESQERYVLAVHPDQLERFEQLCGRERCPFAVLGETSGDGRLILEDSHFKNRPIDMAMSTLLGKTPKMVRDVQRHRPRTEPLRLESIELADAVDRVLRFPAVADKSFLITIADRSITGQVARDQMVGPWQTPVADAAVTTTTLDSTSGETMALGERTPLALLDAPASGRMAIGECLTNLASAPVGEIGKVKLSANWMVAANEPGEDAALFDTVRAVGMELCPALGISIPVGKDSMSMRTSWTDTEGKNHKQSAPLSLLVTGFAAVDDVRQTLTPDLKTDTGLLLLIDLGAGKNRLGASALAQVYGQAGDEAPDLDAPERFTAFFKCIQELAADGVLQAYHDRSDGGLFATLAEMAFAGHKGLDIVLDKLLSENSPPPDILAALFSEELGAVVEVEKDDLARVASTFAQHGLANITRLIGKPVAEPGISIRLGEEQLYNAPLDELHRAWSELSFRMQARRDNPACAREAYDRLLDREDSGICARPSFDPEHAPAIKTQARPLVAIFREQGVNGHNEMAAAFDVAGFEAVDLHMTDLIEGRARLSDFAGLAACGGFSYGDVLGAGSGWAKTILYHEALKEQFAEFFARPDRFTLGVCNGCQMLAGLKDIIPGAENWPDFVRNRSEQFEARLLNVEILRTPSVFFHGMEGSILPIPVAHGEGRADFEAGGSLHELEKQQLIGMRYVDYKGKATELYPGNPNGSPGGATGFTTPDGRATILMPHPERCFRSVQMSYRPSDTFTGEAGPWLRMFRNARTFADGS